MKTNYNKMTTPLSNNYKPEPVQSNSKSVTELDKQEEPQITKHKVDKIEFIVSDCSKLNVREQPSKNSKVHCVVNEGEPVMVDSIADEWAHVYTVSGIEGYVMCSYIKEG